jgi:hypothetical protein
MASAVSMSTYKSLKDKNARYEAAREAFDPKGFKRGRGYDKKEVAAIVKMAGLRSAPTNDDRAAIEVYELVHNKPENIFCYINEKDGTATIWTGVVIGTAHFGQQYKTPAFGGFGSTRVPVTVRAINGCVYAGTYYKSAGDYARLKKTKAACNPASLGGGGAHARGKKMFRLQSLTTAEDVLGGAVTEDNVFIAAYGSVLPGYKHPSKLGVGETTRKKYALSGQRPTTYIIVRES